MSKTFCIAVGSVAFAAFVAVVTPLPAHATSAGPVLYPTKGQSVKTQDQDKYECYDWAKGQSGFDPAQGPAPAPSGSPTTTTSSSTNTMVQGALGAAAIAELSNHNAGKGAAAGALGATVFDRVKQRQQAQAGNSQAAQQQAARSQQQSTYGRAFGACMEGRGYVVK
jgi:hypothetical protein